MDSNKLRVLKEIGYTFHPTCNNCGYSKFEYGISNWGVCLFKKYFHLKHKEDRNLSINKFGSCPFFNKKDNLDFKAFEDYIKGNT